MMHIRTYILKLPMITLFRRLFSWWIAELEQVGTDFKSRFSSGQKHTCEVLVSPNGTKAGSMADFEFKTGGKTPVFLSSRSDWDRLEGKEFSLILEPALCLHLTESFPTTSAERLQSAIDLFIKQNTPFNERSACWAWARAGKHPHTTLVDVILVKRSLLHRIAEGFKAEGREIASFSARLKSSARTLKLSELETPRLKRIKLWRRINLLLFAAASSIFFGTYLVALQNYEDARGRLERQVQVVKQKAITQKKEQIKAQQVAERKLSLTNHKQQHRSVLLAWEQLSQVIPEDAWLTELYLEERQGRIAGFANAAAPLIAVLDRVEKIKQVKFNSPVTINPNDQRERFDISFSFEEAN